MDFRKYNDYEIIDLIKQGNEEALNLMFEKYRYLIAKKIIQFNLTEDFDDFHQEGLMVLYKSVMKFDDTRTKTFTRFFEMNFERHLITLIRSRKRKQRFMIDRLPLLYAEVIQEAKSDYYTEIEIRKVLDRLSDLEKVVFEQRFIQNQEVQIIAKNHQVEPKTIYNAIERIRKKIKFHLDT